MKSYTKTTLFRTERGETIVVDERFRQAIHQGAKKLKHHSVFRQLPMSDIESLLLCEVLTELKKDYDSQKACPKTFIENIIKLRSVNLSRDHHRQKCGTQATHLSLDTSEEMVDDECECFGVTDSSDDTYHKAMQELCKEAVNQKLADLPNDIKDALSLLRIHTVTEVANMVGHPRSTIYNWLKEARTKFDSLYDYLSELH